MTKLLLVTANERRLAHTCTTKHDGVDILGDALVKMHSTEVFWRQIGKSVFYLVHKQNIYAGVFVERDIPRKRFAMTLKLLNVRPMKLQHYVANTDEPIENYYADQDADTFTLLV